MSRLYFSSLRTLEFEAMGRETFSLLTFDVKEVDVGSELVESFRKCSKTLVVLTSI